MAQKGLQLTNVRITGVHHNAQLKQRVYEKNVPVNILLVLCLEYNSFLPVFYTPYPISRKFDRAYLMS